MADIADKRIMILAATGFEQSELMVPKQKLELAGAKVDIVSLKVGHIRGWNDGDWGESVDVDRTIDAVTVDEYDALVIPGGQMNPDFLRADEDAVAFVREFFDSKKPIAAICHAPWVLVEAGVVKGRQMTSYHSMATDLKNAGAHWVDKAVVVDEGLITSRNPDDLDAFSAKIIEEVEEGRHEDRKVA
ncbi:MAG TPA: type 1 glutamine amidotransferase domain-containing protein [Methyloceanibacter sp.]|nr:type 1 glutamine amidotransferase domain-containing protein [Methyloceanibacter sp.]